MSLVGLFLQGRSRSDHTDPFTGVAQSCWAARAGFGLEHQND